MWALGLGLEGSRISGSCSLRAPVTIPRTVCLKIPVGVLLGIMI